ELDRVLRRAEREEWGEGQRVARPVPDHLVVARCVVPVQQIVRVPEVAPLVAEVFRSRMPPHEVEPDQQDRNGINAREEQEARIPGETAVVDGKPIKAWLYWPGKAVP